MSKDVLVVATIAGAENCAATLAEALGSRVEVAGNRRLALEMLRRHAYGVVVVEEYLAEEDPAWADELWQNVGMAMPLEVNFGISGSVRLLREIRAALARRDEEHGQARRAAARAIENDLKSPVTGLLLESELVLREASVPQALEPKLRHLVELAVALKDRLRLEAERA